MARTKKNSNLTNIYALMLLGIGGFVIYKKLKANSDRKKGTVDAGPVTDLGVDDPDGKYSEERGKSYVDKSIYLNKDPLFMDYVTHLQQKLNVIIKKMGGANAFPYYPLKIDGLLGWRTALAVERAFGSSWVPLENLEDIKTLIENFE